MSMLKQAALDDAFKRAIVEAENEINKVVWGYFADKPGLRDVRNDLINQISAATNKVLMDEMGAERSQAVTDRASMSPVGKDFRPTKQ